MAARFLKRPNSAQKQKKPAESFYDRAIQLLKNFYEGLFCFNVFVEVFIHLNIFYLAKNMYFQGVARISKIIALIICFASFGY